ncbi:MAG: ribosome assembly factor SBDS [Candidatus ainarchaeum sp.]|nr:ribosome assembly factor SBDS [Candidatus ainarchaeum sp.]
MATLDQAIIASYKIEGENFEIYVDPKLVYQYLDGSKKDLKNIMIVEEVFSDAKKGEKHSSQKIQKAFGTTDIYKVLEIILRKGSVPLTTEERKRRLEEKTKQIISTILRETIDPRTNAPHTELRVKTALEDAKVHIDPMKNVSEQLPDILKKLRIVIPLKFEKRRVAVKVPAEYAHKCYSTLKNYGIQQEEWSKDGSLIVVIEFPAGMQGEIYNKLNSLTAGAVETKLLETRT